MHVLLTKVDLLFDDVVRAVFHFIENRTDVLPKHAKKYQLDSAEDGYQDRQRRPAWGPGALSQGGDKRQQGQCESQECEQNPNVYAGRQRSLAERDQSVGRKRK